MSVYIDRDQLEEFAMNCVGGVVTMKQIHEFPGVHVPPHGRLIDTSEEITVQMYDDQYEDFYQVKMTIDDLLSQSWIDAKAPTVIPAEEEGE